MLRGESFYGQCRIVLHGKNCHRLTIRNQNGAIVATVYTQTCSKPTQRSCLKMQQIQLQKLLQS